MPPKKSKNQCQNVDTTPFSSQLGQSKRRHRHRGTWQRGPFTRHVVCTNSSGHVDQRWWDADVWRHYDLSDTSAPLSDFAPLTGYAFNAQRTQHVIYLEIVGLHVYELWWQTRPAPTAEIPRLRLQDRIFFTRVGLSSCRYRLRDRQETTLIGSVQ